MRYMLDTNACIGIINRRPATLRERLMQHEPQDIAISPIVHYELLFGVCHSQQKARNQANLDQLLKYIRVADWQEKQSAEAANIRCELTRRGCLIGHYDLLIAAHARALQATLITHNVREFQRVDGLLIEDWEA